MNTPLNDLPPLDVLQSRLTTVRDWIRFTVSSMQSSQVFFGHGSENAYDEAVHLVQSALHLPLDVLDPFLDAKVLPQEQEKLADWLKKRVVDRIPMAYISNTAWLQGYPFYVDERVIVPRSFIAELLSDGLQDAVYDPNEIVRVLDMCTGSGCLAILAAYAFPNADVDAVDISVEALEVAQINLENHQLEDRITLIQANGMDESRLEMYDLILCNPPYVNSQSMSELPEEYKAEPELALAGGDDGMDFIHGLLLNARRHLYPTGVLIVELGNERSYFEQAYPDLPVTWLNVSAGADQVFMVKASDLPE